MIKECPVILNNEAVTVVRYDDITIQFPSIKHDAKKVFVNYENDKYTIVDKMPDEKPKTTAKKRTTKKKTTEEPKVETDDCIDLE